MITSKENKKIQRLFEVFGLPTHLSFDKKIVIDIMKKDKKRRSKDVHFVLLSGIGKAEIIRMPFSELEEYIHDLC
jgi:3-dehydroquinate synthetase